MAYLLDTNHCSRLLEGNPEIQEKVRQFANEDLVICVVVRGELQFMIEHSKNKDENRITLSRFLADLKIYEIDQAVADIYGSLKAALYTRFGPKEKRKRRTTKLKSLGVDENDLWIAAVAKRNNLKIVTSDQGFNRIGEVEP